MAGKEYTAKDKIFSKMTREGLTEETLREGSVKKISQKSRDEPELDSKERDEKNAAPGKRLSDSSGSIWYLGSERSSKEETCSKETDRRTGKIGETFF